MKEHKFELDQGLFKMLCIKNMTGNVSYKSLVTYAVGYNLRRFTVHNRVIQNTNIGYDVIDAHVLISILAMQKLNVSRNLSFKGLTAIN